MMRPGRWSIRLGLLLLDLWLAVTVCSCCGVLSQVPARPTAESPQAVVISSPEPTETTVPPTRTVPPPTPTSLVPTSTLHPPTSTPLPKTATAAPVQTPSPTAVKPTEAPQASSSSALGGLVTIPAEPGATFSIEVTQEEINEYMAGKTYEAQGVKVEDIQFVLTEQELLCTLRITQQQTKLSAGISVRGVPSVADGKAYFKVNDVALDSSVKGFARLLAQGAIDEAVKRYSTPQGIPVPAENVEFEKIQLMPGKILVAGRTR